MLECPGLSHQMHTPFDSLLICGWHWGEGNGTASVLENLAANLPPHLAMPVHVALPLETPIPRVSGIHFHPLGSKNLGHGPWLGLFSQQARYLGGMANPLVFFPSMHLPVGWDAPFVSILHDVLPLHQWEYRLNPFRRHAYLRDIKRHRLAQKVFTVSNFAARDIAHCGGIPLNHIAPVLNGVSPLYQDTRLAMAGGTLAPTQTEPYIFYAGDLRKRKNFFALARAYAMLPKALQHQFTLAFTGEGPHRAKALAFFARRGLSHRVKSLGRLPAAELAQWMAGARLFVFPSLQEGFGLPVAEAQCAGVPVVCGHNSSLPEVTGGFAAFADVGRAARLSGVMAQLLSDEKARGDLARDALAHSLTHSWQRAAAEYAAVLNSL